MKHDALENWMVHRRTHAYAFIVVIIGLVSFGCANSSSTKTTIPRGAARLQKGSLVTSTSAQKCSITQANIAESRMAGGCINIQRIMDAVSTLNSECEVRITTRDVSALLPDTAFVSDQPPQIQSRRLQASFANDLVNETVSPDKISTSPIFKKYVDFRQNDCSEVKVFAPGLGAIDAGSSYTVDPAKSKIARATAPQARGRQLPNTASLSDFQARPNGGALYLQHSQKRGDILKVFLTPKSLVISQIRQDQGSVQDDCAASSGPAAIRTVLTVDWGEKDKLPAPRITRSLAYLITELPGVDPEWSAKSRAMIQKRADSLAAIAKRADHTKKKMISSPPAEADTIPIEPNRYQDAQRILRNLDPNTLQCK